MFCEHLADASAAALKRLVMMCLLRRHPFGVSLFSLLPFRPEKGAFSWPKLSLCSSRPRKVPIFWPIPSIPLLVHQNALLRPQKPPLCNQLATCFQWTANAHSLRKIFGRQVYNMNSENSELALIKLMELFNHSSIAITKRYLGLRQEEILETYGCLTF